jgi:hypothetical protein
MKMDKTIEKAFIEFLGESVNTVPLEPNAMQMIGSCMYRNTITDIIKKLKDILDALETFSASSDELDWESAGGLVTRVLKEHVDDNCYSRVWWNEFTQDDPNHHKGGILKHHIKIPQLFSYLHTEFGKVTHVCLPDITGCYPLPFILNSFFVALIYQTQLDEEGIMILHE